MTITLSYDYALWLFTTLSKFIPKKPAIVIIENCVFEIQPDMVVVRATNIYDEVRIKLPFLEYKHDYSGTTSFLVPVKELLTMLKDCKGASSIKLSPLQDRLNIDIDGVQQSVYMENVSEFPSKLKFDSESIAAYKVDKEDLYDAVDKCYPFTADDELRPAMEGINFEFYAEDNSLRVAATNAHILCVNDYPAQVTKFDEKSSKTRVVKVISQEYEDAEGNKKMFDTKVESNSFISFILNKEMSAFLSYLFLKTKSKNKTLPVSITQYREGTLDMLDIMYSTQSYGTIRIISRCIESRFPEYPAVIPDKDDVNVVVTVKSDMLKDAIKKVKSAAPKSTGKVVFTFTEHFVELRAEDIDFCKSAVFKFQPIAANFRSEVKGKTEYKLGQPFRIAANYKYMLTLLDNFEEVDLYLFTESKALMFYDRYDNTSMALSMPLMLSN
jgi:DNA polymerase-3 subunit beta